MPDAPPQAMVAADGICRTFGSGHTAVPAVRGVSFTVDRGQLVALRQNVGLPRRCHASVAVCAEAGTLEQSQEFEFKCLSRR